LLSRRCEQRSRPSCHLRCASLSRCCAPAPFEGDFAEGTPLGLPAHGLRPYEPCWVLAGKPKLWALAVTPLRAKKPSELPLSLHIAGALLRPRPFERRFCRGDTPRAPRAWAAPLRTLLFDICCADRNPHREKGAQQDARSAQRRSRHSYSDTEESRESGGPGVAGLLPGRSAVEGLPEIISPRG
jgi:hypothetical protein